MYNIFLASCYSAYNRVGNLVLRSPLRSPLLAEISNYCLLNGKTFLLTVRGNENVK